MRRILLYISLLCCSASVFSQTKDIRITYLWDVTLSMKGFNGTPNIYDDVVRVLEKDINLIDNERTEIVVIPFQDTEYCEIWRECATNNGKAKIISQIKGYQNEKITNTNISAPLKYVLENIFSTDRIDILKLLTDGNDNINPTELYKVLDNWCENSKNKDAYGYYILLTEGAKNQQLSLQLEKTCNFSEIDVTKNIKGTSEIIQLSAKFKNVAINVKDDYNKPINLTFEQYLGQSSSEGFEIHFYTEPNPYLGLDTVVVLDKNNSVFIVPQFKLTQHEIHNALPIDHPYDDIMLNFKATASMKDGRFALTRLVDSMCPFSLINKPEKTVKIYVKQKK